ncbi:hypothetical protein Cadr_000029591 [Camelus dromedarius]|uniref:Uncharacterized protein n=1 Tax=Camelus dromedarius TaxID=9838 RepID=A0A5N4CAN4_CAMDR|nr:hypothetical protein Cadr_000029591 [Camelus dromedarius]
MTEAAWPCTPAGESCAPCEEPRLHSEGVDLSGRPSLTLRWSAWWTLSRGRSKRCLAPGVVLSPGLQGSQEREVTEPAPGELLIERKEQEKGRGRNMEFVSRPVSLTTVTLTAVTELPREPGGRSALADPMRYRNSRASTPQRAGPTPGPMGTMTEGTGWGGEPRESQYICAPLELKTEGSHNAPFQQKARPSHSPDGTRDLKQEVSCHNCPTSLRCVPITVREGCSGVWIITVMLVQCTEMTVERQCASGDQPALLTRRNGLICKPSRINETVKTLSTVLGTQATPGKHQWLLRASSARRWGVVNVCCDLERVSTRAHVESRCEAKSLVDLTGTTALTENLFISLRLSAGLGLPLTRGEGRICVRVSSCSPALERPGLKKEPGARLCGRQEPQGTKQLVKVVWHCAGPQGENVGSVGRRPCQVPGPRDVHGRARTRTWKGRGTIPRPSGTMRKTQDKQGLPTGGSRCLPAIRENLANRTPLPASTWDSDLEASCLGRQLSCARAPTLPRSGLCVAAAAAARTHRRARYCCPDWGKARAPADVPFCLFSGSWLGTVGVKCVRQTVGGRAHLQSPGTRRIPESLSDGEKGIDDHTHLHCLLQKIKTPAKSAQDEALVWSPQERQEGLFTERMLLSTSRCHRQPAGLRTGCTSFPTEELLPHSCPFSERSLPVVSLFQALSSCGGKSGEDPTHQMTVCVNGTDSPGRWKVTAYQPLKGLRTGRSNMTSFAGKTKMSSSLPGKEQPRKDARKSRARGRWRLLACLRPPRWRSRTDRHRGRRSGPRGTPAGPQTSLTRMGKEAALASSLSLNGFRLKTFGGGGRPAPRSPLNRALLFTERRGDKAGNTRQKYSLRRTLSAALTAASSYPQRQSRFRAHLQHLSRQARSCAPRHGLLQLEINDSHAEVGILVFLLLCGHSPRGVCLASVLISLAPCRAKAKIVWLTAAISTANEMGSWWSLRAETGDKRHHSQHGMLGRGEAGRSWEETELGGEGSPGPPRSMGQHQLLKARLVSDQWLRAGCRLRARTPGLPRGPMCQTMKPWRKLALQDIRQAPKTVLQIRAPKGSPGEAVLCSFSQSGLWRLRGGSARARGCSCSACAQAGRRGCKSTSRRRTRRPLLRSGLRGRGKGQTLSCWGALEEALPGTRGPAQRAKVRAPRCVRRVTVTAARQP